MRTELTRNQKFRQDKKSERPQTFAANMGFDFLVLLLWFVKDWELMIEEAIEEWDEVKALGILQKVLKDMRDAND